MDDIAEILVDRLKTKGVGSEEIPSFLRILSNVFEKNPDANASEVNAQMRLSGWDNFDLDDQTFQLAVACFEAERLRSDGPLSFDKVERNS